MAKSKESTPEINAASMADIAFLLLIFFLLVTTIDTDAGIARKLPPIPADQLDRTKLPDRNVLVVLLNAANELLVDGERIDIRNLKQKTKEFIMNPQHKPTLADNPHEAVVSLQNDNNTTYDFYIQVQNELTAAYNELRNEEAKNQFGTTFGNLALPKQNVIKQIIPMKISEAEPKNTVVK